MTNLVRFCYRAKIKEYIMDDERSKADGNPGSGKSSGNPVNPGSDHA
jgi:hypothetical protein